jgi:OTU domain-containing protein 3
MHEEVRHEVCDYIEAMRQEFENFLMMEEDDEDVADFDSYVQAMRQDGEWGGNVELVAASRLYR